MAEIDRLKEVVERLRGVDGCKFDYVLAGVDLWTDCCMKCRLMG